jgi:hypothetical protein
MDAEITLKVSGMKIELIYAVCNTKQSFRVITDNKNLFLCIWAFAG